MIGGMIEIHSVAHAHAVERHFKRPLRDAGNSDWAPGRWAVRKKVEQNSILRIRVRSERDWIAVTGNATQRIAKDNVGDAVVRERHAEVASCNSVARLGAIGGRRE